MAIIATVKINQGSSYAVINAADFDESTMDLFVAVLENPLPELQVQVTETPQVSPKVIPPKKTSRRKPTAGTEAT